MAQAKLNDLAFELIQGKETKTGSLKSLVDGMKSLLQSFHYDMNTVMEENNGILQNVRFEIKVKNIKK